MLTRIIWAKQGPQFEALKDRTVLGSSGIRRSRKLLGGPEWVACTGNDKILTKVLRLVDMPMTTPNQRRVSQAGVYSRQSLHVSTPNSRCSDSARNATETLLSPMKRLLICMRNELCQSPSQVLVNVIGYYIIGAGLSTFSAVV